MPRVYLLYGRLQMYTLCDYYTCKSLIPYHNYSNNSNPKGDSQKLIEWSVHLNPTLRDVPFDKQMVDGHINEDTTSNAHGYGIDPVGNRALCRRINDYTYCHTNRTWYTECERIKGTLKEGASRHHSEQRDAHRYCGKNFVKWNCPQRSPCIRGIPCRKSLGSTSLDLSREKKHRYVYGCYLCLHLGLHMDM